MASIARRYAKALLELGVEDGTFEDLGRQVADLARAYRGSPELALALSNPAFPRADRETIVRAVLARLGASPTVVNFARLLLDRERFAALPDIARELGAMIDERAGRVAARVTSATPLDQAQRDRLGNALARLSGKIVQMEVSHDPALLAGVVAKVGDTLYDGSLRTQLDRMKQSLAG